MGQAHEPCHTSGADVRVHRYYAEALAGDEDGDDAVEVRECTSPQCPTNTGQASLADVV